MKRANHLRSGRVIEPFSGSSSDEESLFDKEISAHCCFALGRSGFWLLYYWIGFAWGENIDDTKHIANAAL